MREAWLRACLINKRQPEVVIEAGSKLVYWEEIVCLLLESIEGVKLSQGQLDSIFQAINSSKALLLASKVSLSRTVSLMKERSWITGQLALRLYPQTDYEASLDLLRWLLSRKAYAEIASLLEGLDLKSERELQEWNELMQGICKQARQGNKLGKHSNVSLMTACLCCMSKDAFMAEYKPFLELTDNPSIVAKVLAVYGQLETSLSALGEVYERIWLRCFPKGRKTCLPDANPDIFIPLIKVMSQRMMPLLLSTLLPHLLAGEGFEGVSWKRVRLAMAGLRELLADLQWEQLCRMHFVSPCALLKRIQTLLEVSLHHFQEAGFIQRGLPDTEPMVIKKSHLEGIKAVLTALKSFSNLDQQAYELVAQLSLVRNSEMSQACLNVLSDDHRQCLVATSRALTHSAYPHHLVSEQAILQRQFKQLTKHLSHDLLPLWTLVGLKVMDKSAAIPLLSHEDPEHRQAAHRVLAEHPDAVGLQQVIQGQFMKRSKRHLRAELATLLAQFIQKASFAEEQVILPCIIQLREEESVEMAQPLAELVLAYHRHCRQRLPFRLQSELWLFLSRCSKLDSYPVQACLTALCHRLLCPPAFARPDPLLNLDPILAWCHRQEPQIKLQALNNLLVDCPSIGDRLLEIAYAEDLPLHFEQIYDEATALVYRLFHGQQENPNPFMTLAIAQEVRLRLQQVKLTSRRQSLLKILRRWIALVVDPKVELWDCLQSIDHLDGCEREMQGLWQTLCRLPHLLCFTLQHGVDLQVLKWIAPLHPDLAVLCLAKVDAPQEHWQTLLRCVDRLSEPSVALLHVIGLEVPPVSDPAMVGEMAFWLFGQTRSLSLLWRLLPMLQRDPTCYLDRLLLVQEEEGVVSVIYEMCSRWPCSNSGTRLCLLQSKNPFIFTAALFHPPPLWENQIFRGLFWPETRPLVEGILQDDDRLAGVKAIMAGQSGDFFSLEEEEEQELVAICLEASGHAVEWCRLSARLDYSQVSTATLRLL